MTNILKLLGWPFRKFGLVKTSLILLVIIILAVIFFPKGSSNNQLQYQTVGLHEITQTVSASGVLDGKNTADLHFKAGGKISQVNVSVGDTVKKGDILATLDTQQLGVDLETAQNNLRTAQAQLEKTLDDIHLFQYGNGGFSNVGSSNETETQKQDRISAQMNVNNAKDAVTQAQLAFDDAVMAAPFDGIITKVPLLSGQVAAPTDLVTEIVDESQIYFDADIDESDIAKVSINQPVDISLNAYPNQNFKGQVSEIKPTTKTTSSGATVVTTRIVINNPPTQFVSGLNGQATIETGKATNVVTIPADALREDNTVLVKKSDGLHAVPVTTGLESDTDIEITSGLHTGDQIVVNPSAVSNSLIKK